MARSILCSYPMLAALLALLSGLMVIFNFIQMGGIGINADSMTWIAMADHLRGSGKFLLVDLKPHTYEFPPGYSVFLFLASFLTGSNMYYAAMILNVLSHITLVFFALLWLRSLSDDKFVRIAGIAVIILATPLLSINRVSMSDQIPMAIAMAVIFWLCHIQKKQHIGWLTVIGITILVTAATMTRWLGISLGITSAVIFALVIWQGPGRGDTELYLRTLPPVIVPILLAVTWSITGTEGAGQGQFLTLLILTIMDPSSPALKSMSHIFIYIFGWFVPIDSFMEPKEFASNASLWVHIVGWSLLMVAFATSVLLLIRGIIQSRYAVPFVFVVVYLSFFLLAICTIWDNDLKTIEPSSRRLLPVYAPVLLSILAFSVGLIRSNIGRIYAWALKGVLGLYAVGLVAVAAFGVYGFITVSYDGSWLRYYDTRFAEEVRRLAASEKYLHSNYYLRVYYLADQPTQAVFWLGDREIPKLPGDYVVLVNHVPSYIASTESVLEYMDDQGIDFEITYEDELGLIYRFLPPR